eukprot:886223_1
MNDAINIYSIYYSYIWLCHVDSGERAPLDLFFILIILIPIHHLSTFHLFFILIILIPIHHPIRCTHLSLGLLRLALMNFRIAYKHARPIDAAIKGKKAQWLCEILPLIRQYTQANDFYEELHARVLPFIVNGWDFGAENPDNLPLNQASYPD